MKAIAKANRDLLLINSQNTQNENEVETIEIQVPEQFEDFNKKVVFVTPDGVVWDIVENNQYKITNALTKYEQVEFYIWLTRGNEDYRTKTRTLTFYDNQDATGQITPEEISGINHILDILDADIVKVENLNITATKVDNITTITITDKDGETTTIQILDGEKGEPGDDYVITPEDYQAIANIVLSSIVIPSKTSDLTNDSGFITKSVDDLTNYYKKSETYNKTEIDTKVSSVYKYKGTVATYSDLPSTGLTVGDVYNVESDGSNYAWTGTQWDKLGGEVDLSGYYNKTQTDELLSGKVNNSQLNDYYTKTRTDELLGAKQNTISSNNKLASDLVDDTNQTNKFVTSAEKTTWNAKLDTSDLADYVKNTDYAMASVGGVIKSANGLNISSASGGTWADTYIYENYDRASNALFIGKGTLENAITGKGLVSNTDYATENTAGVIKVNSNGIGISNAGKVYAVNYNYSDYINVLSNTHFISKGTLENVITGKDLTTKAYVDGLVGDLETILETLDVGGGI